MAQILQPLNGDAGLHSAPVFTFAQYVQDVFLPAYRQKWKESTRSTSEPDIVRYLIPALGTQRLDKITREQMQSFLEQLGKRLTASVVGHARWHLNAIFRMAQSDGAISFNPANALFIPECKASREKGVMTGYEVRAALGVLDLRERLILRLAVFSGMRPGEIFSVRLGKIADTSILVDERTYQNKFDRPKGRKGKNTTRRVGVSPGTAKDIDLWRSFLPDQSETAFLFPSEAVTTPLRPNNHWKRDVRPRLEAIGLEWVNYQVLRRTNASLSRKTNVDDKVSADQRGHGLGVSLGVYSISDLDQKIEAVTKLESSVLSPENGEELSDEEFLNLATLGKSGR